MWLSPSLLNFNQQSSVEQMECLAIMRSSLSVSQVSLHPSFHPLLPSQERADGVQGRGIWIGRSSSCGHLGNHLYFL